MKHNEAKANKILTFPLSRLTYSNYNITSQIRYLQLTLLFYRAQMVEESGQKERVALAYVCIC
jgi:hypothetical protein